jgi:hypothetical protein
MKEKELNSGRLFIDERSILCDKRLKLINVWNMLRIVLNNNPNGKKLVFR